MASEKQIAANRANAQKSRGPRSPGGKMRSSANATSHGLAANFRRDSSAVYSIDALANLMRKAGFSEQKAQLAAVAEYEVRSVLTVRSKFLEELRDSAQNAGDALLEGMQKLDRIERYEKRATSRRKRVFWQIGEATSKQRKLAERTQFSSIKTRGEC